MKYLNPAIIALIFAFSFSVSAKADKVSISISDKINAEAEYLQGEEGKTAALILHGYLSTNNFHTVKSMAGALADEGFSVLSPTLSLNINRRKSSLKCESVHTHTLQDDINEIVKWVEWLESKGHQRIVLVGHSSGSQELLAAMSEKPKKSVVGLYLTSLFYLNGPELGVSAKELKQAESLLGKNTVKKYSFLFCQNNYFATPDSFLSYHKLTRKQILQDLMTIKNNGVKIHVTMGSADKRYKKVGENWLTDIEKTGVNMSIIDGANHFFSDEHEFDLQEQIVETFDEHF